MFARSSYLWVGSYENSIVVASFTITLSCNEAVTKDRPTYRSLSYRVVDFQRSLSFSYSLNYIV